MKKFIYQSYDYSFLIKEDNVSFAKRVFAKTIGYDLTTVRPMNEPVGRLFYFDNTSSLSNSITYEPIRTGGWEMHFDNVPTATWSSSTSNLASINSYATSPSYNIIGTTITNT